MTLAPKINPSTQYIISLLFCIYFLKLIAFANHNIIKYTRKPYMNKRYDTKVRFGQRLQHLCFGRDVFQLFFFFPLHTFQLGDRSYCSHCAVAVHALFHTVHVIFSHFFIKNGSHGTIHTFKNCFATVFSVFSFSKINSIQTYP